MNNQIVTPDFTASARIPAEGTPKTMLTVTREGNGHIVRINSSSLSLLQTCARKSMYVLHQGWRPKSGSPPLVFGGAIHKALETFYLQPRKERGEIPPDFAEIAQTLAHGYEPPAAHFLYDAVKSFVKAAEPLRGLPDTDKRSLAAGIWTLTHYFKTYFNDPFVTLFDENGPVIERTCEHILFDSPKLQIIVFGTIDFVLQNEINGHTLPGDHKTSSQMGNDFLNRIKPNHQYTGYVFLAQKELNLQTEDFLVNGIQVKARPLTSRGGPPTFTRQITKRTADDMHEFQIAVVEACENHIRHMETDTWPVGHVDACSNFGGCGFLEICSAPNSLRNNILESKYART